MIEVTKCFSSLLRWVIDLLPQTNQELLIALDATNIGQNFTVLSINVLYRRCAIPVASESRQRNIIKEVGSLIGNNYFNLSKRLFHLTI